MLCVLSSTFVDRGPRVPDGGFDLFLLIAWKIWLGKQRCGLLIHFPEPPIRVRKRMISEAQAEQVQ